MCTNETKLVINNKKTIRLVCPECGEGFIKANEQIMVTGRRGMRHLGIKAPSCSNCGASYLVDIDNTLKITLERQ